MYELPILFTPIEVARMMGVNRSQVYILMNQGKLASVSIGRSHRVTINQMQDFIDALPVSNTL